MNFQNVLDAFFLPEDQDGFAQAQGYEDAEQMCYYEDMMGDSDDEALVAQEEAIAAGRVEYMSPPPIELLTFVPETSPLVTVHELAKVDSREVYEDEACPLRAWYDTSAELEGVY